MTQLIRFPILLSATAILMSACGFQPMYGDYSAASQSSALSQVAVEVIPDREGQILRNDLIDRLYQGGYPSSPTATLKIDKIEEQKTELDLTKSSEATRAQLRLSTKMALADSAGKVLLTRNLQTITSYNILGSEFATRVTEESARQSAIHDLARQAELNLSLYYTAK